MNLNLFVARRLFQHPSGTGKVSRSALRIATAGVAVGVAVMIVSVSVVMGFKHEIRSKVMGFGAHLQVLNYKSLNSDVRLPLQISPELMQQVAAVPGVRHVQRFCDKEGLLKTDDGFKGIVLRGVGPEFDSTFLAAHLQEGSIPCFSDTMSGNAVVLSRQIADELRLEVGDRVYAYFLDKAVSMRRFTVKGIYCTHMTEFDKALVFTDLYTCNRLQHWKPDQSCGLEVQVHDERQIEEVGMRMVQLVNRRTDDYGECPVAVTIQELYPQIFSWLELLDMNVWVILALMVAVAGFTMTSGLLIVILERTNFIGVMKALGATNTAIRRIFLYFSVFVIGRGLLWGNVVGLALVALQHYTGLIRLDASVYYVEVVPVLLIPLYIIGINVATLLVSVGVLVVPSYLVSNIHPARSIRFE